MSPKWSKFGRVMPKRLKAHTQDTTKLVRDYLVQETVEPLRSLSRYVIWGTLGSVFVGAGSFMLLIGLLRLLQQETTAFHGNFSWAPYLIVVAAATSLIALTVLRIVTGPARRRRTPADAESS